MNLIEPNTVPKVNLGKEEELQRKNKRLNIKSIIWLSISVVTLLLNFLPNNLIDPFSYGQKKSGTEFLVTNKKHSVDKEFDSKLAPRFRSLDAVLYYVKKHVKDTADKLAQFEVLDKLMRQRFVHAYSVYGMHENWIAVLAGRLIWRDLSAKVIPDDILKGESAACSQVSIVLMEACRRMGIPSRKVGLKGHYAMEAFINKKWYFSDANLKPNFDAINGRKSVHEIIKEQEHFKLYANTNLDSADIADKFSTILYGKTNTNHAPRAHFFQTTTKELSHWGWLIPLFVSVFYWRKIGALTDMPKQPFEPEFLQQFQSTVL